MPPRVTAAATAVLALIAVGAPRGVIAQDAPPWTDPASWRDIASGTAAAQVLEALGPPTEKMEVPGAPRLWYYGRDDRGQPLGMVTMERGTVTMALPPSPEKVRDWLKRHGIAPAAGGVGDGPPAWFAPEKWAQIREGMSKEQVESLIGPATQAVSAGGMDQWVYSAVTPVRVQGVVVFTQGSVQLVSAPDADRIAEAVRRSGGDGERREPGGRRPGASAAPVDLPQLPEVGAGHAALKEGARRLLDLIDGYRSERDRIATVSSLLRDIPPAEALAGRASPAALEGAGDADVAARLGILSRFMDGQRQQSLVDLLDAAGDSRAGMAYLASLAAWRHRAGDIEGFEAALGALDEEVEFATDIRAALGDEVDLLVGLNELDSALDRVHRYGTDQVEDGELARLRGRLIAAGRLDDAAAIGADVTDMTRRWDLDRRALEDNSAAALLARRRVREPAELRKWDTYQLLADELLLERAVYLACAGGREELLDGLAPGTSERSVDQRLWDRINEGPLFAGRAVAHARAGRLAEAREAARSIRHRRFLAIASAEIASAYARKGDTRRAARIVQQAPNARVPESGSLVGAEVSALRRLSREISQRRAAAGDVAEAIEVLFDWGFSRDGLQGWRAATIARIFMEVGRRDGEAAVAFLDAALDRTVGEAEARSILLECVLRVTAAGAGELAATMATEFRAEALSRLRSAGHVDVSGFGPAEAGETIDAARFDAAVLARLSDEEGLESMLEIAAFPETRTAILLGATEGLLAGAYGQRGDEPLPDRVHRDALGR